MPYRVYPNDESQSKIVKAFFDALQVPYEFEPDMDTTEYLLSTEANRKALYESIVQEREGKGIKVNLDDIWKE